MNLKQLLRSLVLFLQVSDNWRAFLLLSLCLQLVSWIIVFYWSRGRWHNHPISKMLQAHVQPSFSSWGSVAVSINTEFRHIDKFATGAPGARVIVTDTWVLKVSVNKYISAYSFFFFFGDALIARQLHSSSFMHCRETLCSPTSLSSQDNSPESPIRKKKLSHKYLFSSASSRYCQRETCKGLFLVECWS